MKTTTVAMMVAVLGACGGAETPVGDEVTTTGTTSSTSGSASTTSSGTTSGGSMVCTPGASVACVGVGGCQGGQVCNSDGTAFGTCECAQGTTSTTSASSSTSGGTTGDPATTSSGSTSGGDPTTSGSSTSSGSTSSGSGTTSSGSSSGGTTGNNLPPVNLTGLCTPCAQPSDCNGFLFCVTDENGNGYCAPQLFNGCGTENCTDGTTCVQQDLYGQAGQIAVCYPSSGTCASPDGGTTTSSSSSSSSGTTTSSSSGTTTGSSTTSSSSGTTSGGTSGSTSGGTTGGSTSGSSSSGTTSGGTTGGPCAGASAGASCIVNSVAGMCNYTGPLSSDFDCAVPGTQGGACLDDSECNTGLTCVYGPPLGNVCNGLQGGGACGGQNQACCNDGYREPQCETGLTCNGTDCQ
jgi:hypothetical protein